MMAPGGMDDIIDTLLFRSTYSHTPPRYVGFLPFPRVQHLRLLVLGELCAKPAFCMNYDRLMLWRSGVKESIR